MGHLLRLAMGSGAAMSPITFMCLAPFMFFMMRRPIFFEGMPPAFSRSCW